MLKKALILVVIVGVFCSEGRAQEPKFETLILPSLMDIDLDPWYKIPANSGPNLRRTEEVVKNQLVSIFVLFSGYTIESRNNIEVTYDVQIFDPDGEPTEDKGLGIVGYQGQAGNADVLLLNQQIMRVMFTDDYPYGTYQIKVKAYDNVSGATFTSTTPIKLEPFSFDFRFADLNAANVWMMNYYQELSPQKAIAAVQIMVQTDPDWITKHLSIVSFFSRVFADNPYLLNNIARQFDSFSVEDQKRFLLIDHFVGENQLSSYGQSKPFSDFSQQLQNIFFPALSAQISNPLQLDMLWSEFLATGKYEPIRKLVSALALVKYKGTLDKIKQDKLELNDELKRDAYLDATYQSAVWSLLSNNKTMPLVNKYCHFIYQNEDLTVNVKQQLAIILRRVQLDSVNKEQ
jgi:hypothetical protein